jgi:hypothetical protein
MRRARLILAAAITSAIGAPAVAQVTIQPADGAAGHRFGFSIALDADRLAVGSPRDHDGGAQSGSVYVHSFDGTGWSEDQKLTASDAFVGDEFGFWVDLDQAVLLAGGPSPGLGFHPGAAYVDDGVAADRFGLQVAVDGDVAVATAPYHAGETGAAYVFRFDGTTWGQEQKLVASDGAADDFFGGGGALDGDRIVVGAERENGEGAAYVYRFEAGAWVEEAKLVAETRGAGDEFGHSVELEGEEIVVGAPFEGGAGAAYVFRRLAGTWVQQQRLAASDAAAGDEFGRHVVHALEGDALLIGASRDDDAGVDSGSVYRFRRELGVWVEAGKVDASPATAGDELGFVVAPAGDRLAAGAPFDDAGVGAGSVTIFSIPTACGDGVDNDGDSLVDHPADWGCSSALDPSERSTLFACDDGRDGDEDGGLDFPMDPGCFHAVGATEAPACDDGEDNDNDGGVDLADASCADRAWWNSEHAARPACGLGAELAALVPMFAWARRRLRRTGRSLRGRES